VSWLTGCSNPLGRQSTKAGLAPPCSHPIDWPASEGLVLMKSRAARDGRAFSSQASSPPILAVIPARWKDCAQVECQLDLGYRHELIIHPCGKIPLSDTPQIFPCGWIHWKRQQTVCRASIPVLAFLPSIVDPAKQLCSGAGQNGKG